MKIQTKKNRIKIRITPLQIHTNIQNPSPDRWSSYHFKNIASNIMMILTRLERNFKVGGGKQKKLLFYDIHIIESSAEGLVLFISTLFHLHQWKSHYDVRWGIGQPQLQQCQLGFHRPKECEKMHLCLHPHLQQKFK